MFEAKKLALCEGHDKADTAGAEDFVGVFAGVVALYWAPKRVKSEFGRTLFIMYQYYVDSTNRMNDIRFAVR